MTDKKAKKISRALISVSDKKNIEELELQQSELLEGLLEEETFTEPISEVSDIGEQFENEDEKFREWDRVLRRYQGLIEEIQSRL